MQILTRVTSLPPVPHDGHHPFAPAESLQVTRALWKIITFGSANYMLCKRQPKPTLKLRYTSYLKPDWYFTTCFQYNWKQYTDNTVLTFTLILRLDFEKTVKRASWRSTCVAQCRMRKVFEKKQSDKRAERCLVLLLILVNLHVKLLPMFTHLLFQALSNGTVVTSVLSIITFSAEHQS